MKKDGFDVEKQKMLSRRRRLIFNNDGCDIFQVPGNPSSIIKDFLELRTAPLVDTHVDVISYSTISSGFGLFTHNTRIGEILTEKHPDMGGNIAPLLIKEGRDCLEIVVDFGHKHNMEIFWSMRMNDTHDGVHRDDNPHFLFPALKQKHPEYLIGEPDKRPLHGSWSAVDYSNEEIRKLACLFVEEVCQNYDVDGIELDFFRHPVFFKKTSEGMPAGNGERGQMTDLMGKIAGVLEAEGRKRGRPFLLAARTPDDVAYCNTIGLEIERWMAEGIIDIYIPSGYFRLNSWDYSVRLGHKYEVKVYPGLSESRVGGGHHADNLRASDECYRARAANVWNAGADGVYIFNLFDSDRMIWRELGEPDKLKSKDKVCFASCRGIGQVAGGAYPHEHFIRISTINPEAPIHIKPDEKKAIKIEIGEKPEEFKQENTLEVKLFVKIVPDFEDMGNLTISFNGNELHGEGKDKNVEFILDKDYMREGTNTVEVCYRGKRNNIQIADVMVSINYSGSFMESCSYISRTRDKM